MYAFKRLNKLPGGSLEGAIALCDKRYWSLQLVESAGQWSVYAGADILLRSDTRAVADAFVYGLGLACSVLPGDIFAELEATVRRIVEQLKAPEC